MKLLDLTFPSPAENLACEEALLDWCDESGEQVLRFWEPATPFVVVGYANKIASEVNTAACAAAGIPIYRRCSGGGTVLQAPGCLNYAVVLQIQEQGWTAGVSGTNHFVMHRNREALESVLGRRVDLCGHTDLALNGRKFSGNAQRRKRRALLFHGTFLCRCDPALIEATLRFPSQQPEYRQGRRHAEFVTELGLDPAPVKESLKQTWEATECFTQVPTDEIARLAAEKYSTEAWNRKF